MRVQTSIEFTEMKKNKKESLKFTLKGDDSKGIGKQLYDMAGSIVHLNIKDCAIGAFPAEFVDIKKSAKGVVANFLLKGDLTDAQAGSIYSHSNKNVELTVEESQMTIEDFRDGDEDREGVRGNVNPDGTIDLDNEEDDEQVTIDEVMQGVDDAPSNVTSLTGKQTKKQKEEAAKLAQQAQDVAVNETPLPFSDDPDPDDLPL